MRWTICHCQTLSVLAVLGLYRVMRLKIGTLIVLLTWHVLRRKSASSMLKRLGFLLVVLTGLICQPALADSKIFVASSLADVVGALVEASKIGDLQVVIGSSSSLARQIKAGAPADLFISANKDWAQFVAGDEKLQPLFSNRLVLISHKAQTLSEIEQLPALLGTSRLAISDPDHVPAGIYAREALVSAQLWNSVGQKLAPADNVRAAARLVQSGVAPSELSITLMRSF